ncbi:biotin transporter BioY [Paracoccus caeni]|uniref:Biotin transporter n=1 Tax=Paracoccus caeni TaxID=657651 RepID=A0A934SD86_9RHOB|nr:biotin transporter BioY [Paracoccus caeni]MBK4215757.1 biotin transporter BioY [Paracoccus caeni]
MPFTPQLTASPVRYARQTAAIALGVALMTLAAKVQIPFWPVPMTLHTMAVMGFAVLLGPRMATAIFAAYLAAGAAGLPVFSGTPERGIGIAYMVGPTGGYLLGYLIASTLTGWLAAGRGIIGQMLAMLAGLAVTYTLGALWLLNFVPADKVIAAGIAPFLPGDLFKIAIVALGTSLIAGLFARLKALP